MTANKEERSGVWIGPTQCDEERTSRIQDVDQVWSIVKVMLEGDNFKASVYGMVSVSIDLIRESLSCYQNGAYLAACGICRSSTEALLYRAMTQRPTSNYETVEIKENYLREKRGQFVRAALEKKLIDADDLRDIEEIWKVGDFAMHIEQKRDQQVEMFASATIELDETLKGWSNRNEALRILTETAKLVSKIMARLNSTIQ